MTSQPSTTIAHRRNAAKSAAGSSRALSTLALLGVVAGVASGCSAIDRLAEVGEDPRLSAIENPQRQPGYEPVTLPMPRPELAVYRPNSLWRTGAKAFFKDQRAARVGDILTVQIAISDSASLENSTESTRTKADDNDISTLLGFEASLIDLLPDAVNPNNLIDVNTSETRSGEGSVERGEEIDLKISAIVMQVLPNGNMVIHGRQEMRVNAEVRELAIDGVVRPEDITAQNTIPYEKIAEARVIYGGRGVISDVQRPRYGTQILDIIYPF